jgi:hypothetical protein
MHSASVNRQREQAPCDGVAGGAPLAAANSPSRRAQLATQRR